MTDTQTKTKSKMDAPTYDQMMQEVCKLQFMAFSLSSLEQQLPQNLTAGAIATLHGIANNIIDIITDPMDDDENE